MLPDRIDLILRDIKKNMYENIINLKQWTIQEVKKNYLNEYMRVNKKEQYLTSESSYWDNTGKIFFFEKDINLPEDLERENLYLHINISGECTLFINDEVYRGINEENIKLINIKENKLSFRILATHDVQLSFKHKRAFNTPYPPHLFSEAFIYNKNNIIENYYVLAKTLKKTIKTIDSNKNKDALFKILQESIYKIDFFTNNKNAFLKSINKSYNYLMQKLKSIDYTKQGTVFILGHSHLDIAFKWTITDSIRKIERTIGTTLNLMDSFDDYYFIQSQALIYFYIKKYYPELYNKLKIKHKEEQLIIEGSFWVEADLNIPNGESIIRQILYGKKFYKQEFNFNSNTAWLPDSFGFSAILPQILVKSNIDYFITTKLQWNDTNSFPYNIFKWEGIDQSQISSYLLSDTYGGNLEPKKIYNAWENKKQNNIAEVLSLYGFGDGGGGNTEEQLNKIDSLKKMPYIPNVKTGTITNHLKSLFSHQSLPLWKGELYLEKHRGTYTSKAKLKKYNRKLEFFLKDIELLYSITLLNGFKDSFDLINLWKILLKNQFHDILTGSCIDKVSNTAISEYKTLENELLTIKNNIFDYISNLTGLKNNQYLFFNSYSFAITDLLFVNSNNITSNYNSVKINDKIYPIQINNDKLYFKINNFKQFTFKKVTLINKDNITYNNSLKSSKYSLENKFIKVLFDNNGEITSIYDKEKSIEYIKKNKKANKLTLYNDKSSYFDTWDISITEKNKRDINMINDIKIKNKGPYFHSIIITRNFYNSSVTQEIILYDNKRKIDFKTIINWQERQKLLKTIFPINIDNASALFDLSMGFIERENYKKTSWEKAKTEVAAHKWVNLNNSERSVSLLNNCKYGHQIDQNTIKLTLLKSGIYPDQNADLGKHIFSYSILLNPNPININLIEKEALKLNKKPLSYTSNRVYKQKSNYNINNIFDIKNENILVDSFKVSEDNKGYILRIHEFTGNNTELKIKINKNTKYIYETDLMENITNKLSDKNIIYLKIKSFEIKTFKIIFK
ncbi:MAG: hypothetical protein K9K32_00705 [Halanaerobiales bacterium]|nr:hypothetical protein [Halanaerobiales bacterium]